MVSQRVDFSDPKYFENRELSWLDFNERVIAQAEDDRNPLLEQLKFISIGSSNLDEFVRVRVAGLQDQSKLGVTDPDTKKQWSPNRQLDEIASRNEKNVKYQYGLYKKKMAELKEAGVKAPETQLLEGLDSQALRDYFAENIQPGITPYGVKSKSMCKFYNIVTGVILWAFSFSVGRRDRPNTPFGERKEWASLKASQRCVRLRQVTEGKSPFSRGRQVLKGVLKVQPIVKIDSSELPNSPVGSIRPSPLTALRI